MNTDNSNLVHLNLRGNFGEGWNVILPTNAPAKVSTALDRMIAADRAYREAVVAANAAEDAAIDAERLDEAAMATAYEEGRGDEVDPRALAAPAEEAAKAARARVTPARVGGERVYRALREAVVAEKPKWQKAVRIEAETSLMEIVGLARGIEIEIGKINGSFGVLELLHGDELPPLELAVMEGSRETALLGQAIELINEAIAGLDAKRRAL